MAGAAWIGVKNSNNTAEVGPCYPTPRSQACYIVAEDWTRIPESSSSSKTCCAVGKSIPGVDSGHALPPPFLTPRLRVDTAARSGQITCLLSRVTPTTAWRSLKAISKGDLFDRATRLPTLSPLSSSRLLFHRRLAVDPPLGLFRAQRLCPPVSPRPISDAPGGEERRNDKVARHVVLLILPIDALRQILIDESKAEPPPSGSKGENVWSSTKNRAKRLPNLGLLRGGLTLDLENTRITPGGHKQRSSHKLG